MSKKPTHTDEQEQQATDAIAEYEAAQVGVPMYDEEPPARFFNGGGTHDEIEQWKEAHLITAKATKKKAKAEDSDEDD